VQGALRRSRAGQGESRQARQAAGAQVSGPGQRQGGRAAPSMLRTVGSTAEPGRLQDLRKRGPALMGNAASGDRQMAACHMRHVTTWYYLLVTYRMWQAAIWRHQMQRCPSVLSPNHRAHTLPPPEQGRRMHRRSPAPTTHLPQLSHQLGGGQGGLGRCSCQAAAAAVQLASDVLLATLAARLGDCKQQPGALLPESVPAQGPPLSVLVAVVLHRQARPHLVPAATWHRQARPRLVPAATCSFQRCTCGQVCSRPHAHL
jgi:hypothetical protein